MQRESKSIPNKTPVEEKNAVFFNICHQNDQNRDQNRCFFVQILSKIYKFFFAPVFDFDLGFGSGYALDDQDDFTRVYAGGRKNLRVGARTWLNKKLHAIKVQSEISIFLETLVHFEFRFRDFVGKVLINFIQVNICFSKFPNFLRPINFSI